MKNHVKRLGETYVRQWSHKAGSIQVRTVQTQHAQGSNKHRTRLICRRKPLQKRQKHAMNHDYIHPANKQAMINSDRNVNSELLCNVEKTDKKNLKIIFF